MIDPGQHTPAGSDRAVTARSVLIGTFVAAGICAVTAYNDYVVANTLLIGSYLPLAMVLVMFVLVVPVNGLLHRVRPARALRSGELAVILAMGLAACAVASQGLVRTLLPTLVGPFHHARGDAAYWDAFTGMGLPQWLFPVERMDEGRTSPIITHFYARRPPGEPVPYSAWVIPLLGWGVYVAAMLLTMLSLAVILGPQWSKNERLPFPLAQLGLAIIESPQQGRALNRLFASRGFWIAVAAVMLIHFLAGLNIYFPRHVPAVPVKYNIERLLANEPWVHLPWVLKSQSVYFTFVGISFFIAGRTSFSLWFMVVFAELFKLQRRMSGADIPWDAWQHQHLGAGLGIFLAVVWIGRTRLRQVWHCLRRPPPEGSENLLLRPAALVVLAGPMVMAGWLIVAGTQWWVALLIVALTLMAHVVIARVVAETGLPFIASQINPLQIVTTLPTSVLSGRDVFHSGAMTMIGSHPTRESLLVFALHANAVAEQSMSRPADRRATVGLVGASAIVGAAIAIVASLWCYYTYAMPLASSDSRPINAWASEVWTSGLLVGPIKQFASGQFTPRTYDPATHMAIGLAITLLLQAAVLRWNWWPLMPVGYLLCSSWFAQTAWFSLMIGWAIKMLIIRFGGVGLFVAARPIFIGLIVGEALAAGLWMSATLVMAWLGFDYRVVNLLPT